MSPITHAHMIAACFTYFLSIVPKKKKKPACIYINQHVIMCSLFAFGIMFFFSNLVMHITVSPTANKFRLQYHGHCQGTNWTMYSSSIHSLSLGWHWWHHGSWRVCYHWWWPVASSSGHSQLFNVAHWKARGPGMWQHVSEWCFTWNRLNCACVHSSFCGLPITVSWILCESKIRSESRLKGIWRYILTVYILVMITLQLRQFQCSAFLSTAKTECFANYTEYIILQSSWCGCI